MSPRGNNLKRVRGWLLQFKVIFGLTFSVITGFFSGISWVARVLILFGAGRCRSRFLWVREH